MNQEIKLTLPKSGAIVVLKPFITTGQSRELQKTLLSKGEIDTVAGGVKNVSPDTFLDMQDRAAELLIVGYSLDGTVDMDGKLVAFSKEWLYDLPVEDGNMIYDKINELIGASSLSEESKKK